MLSSFEVSVLYHMLSAVIRTASVIKHHTWYLYTAVLLYYSMYVSLLVVCFVGVFEQLPSSAAGHVMCGM